MKTVNDRINTIMQAMAGERSTKHDLVFDWLNNDWDSVMAVTELMIGLGINGWSVGVSVDDFQDNETNELSKRIYDLAVMHFKKATN